MERPGDGTGQSRPVGGGLVGPWFAVLLVLAEGLLGALGLGLAYLTRGENLLTALRPELPWRIIARVGTASGVGGALLVLLLYRFVPAYHRAAAPVVELLRRLPRTGLWAVALVAAVAEELLFRGALQPLLGLWGTALVFGLLHTGFRRAYLAYGLTAAGLGLLLGASYWYLGELWAPILAHAVYNALVVAALPLVP